LQLDTDEIRDARQYAFLNSKESNKTEPFNIFLAVLAAILVAWFIRAAYVEWQLKRTLETFNQQMAVVNANLQRDMELSQIRSRAEVEERARVQQEKDYQQRLAKHQLALAKQAAIDQAINERDRKAQAWADYYKPVKGCEPSNDNKDLMLCANDHARAKKNFETQWGNDQFSRSNVSHIH